MYANEPIRIILFKVMNTEMYEELRQLSTSKGYRLDDIIQSGVDNPGNPNSFSVERKRLSERARERVRVYVRRGRKKT